MRGRASVHGPTEVEALCPLLPPREHQEHPPHRLHNLLEQIRHAPMHLRARQEGGKTPRSLQHRRCSGRVESVKMSEAAVHRSSRPKACVLERVDLEEIIDDHHDLIKDLNCQAVSRGRNSGSTQKRKTGCGGHQLRGVGRAVMAASRTLLAPASSMPTSSRCSSVSSVSLKRADDPRTAFSGVRTSWLTVRMNLAKS